MTQPIRFLLRRLSLAALAALAVLLLPAVPASAQTAPLDLQSFYRLDLRALAMGNAFTPIARGENALLYNPAGLVQYRLDVKIEASAVVEGEAGPFLRDTYNVFTGSPSNQEVQDYLTKYDGTPTKYYRAQTFVNGVANLAAFNIGLGAGLLDQKRYGLTFIDNAPAGFDAGDRLKLTEQDLNMKLAAFGLQIFEGQLLMGVAFKNFTFEDKAFVDTFGNIIASGNVKLATVGPKYTASAYDVGFIWRLGVAQALRAQVGVVANNVGGISLQQSGFPTREVPASYDFGIAINPKLIGPIHLLASAEYEDLSGTIKVQDAGGTDHSRSTAQRLHLGAELGFWETSTGNNVLNLRLGSNRGLATYGMELNLWSVFRLVYTRYKDDFGYDAVKDVHEFQAIQLTLGIGF